MARLKSNKEKYVFYAVKDEFRMPATSERIRMMANDVIGMKAAKKYQTQGSYYTFLLLKFVRD